ncbi:MAG: hypothetical protein EU549_02465 [Promethearchaeota archaeon]|nr:MAG: hypothetical protein EU549_02465 [Candidatus Lokiarchaeota archaeon]
MGLWSKIKEIFIVKSIETFKELEEDLNKLFKKCDMRLIALVGTASKIKGLPLIYAAEKDKEDVRLFSARIIKILSSVQELSKSKKLDNVTINYEDQIIYTEPILENICLLAIYRQENDIYSIKQWINNNITILRSLLNKH